MLYFSHHKLAQFYYCAQVQSISCSQQMEAVLFPSVAILNVKTDGDKTDQINYGAIISDTHDK